MQKQWNNTVELNYNNVTMNLGDENTIIAKERRKLRAKEKAKRLKLVFRTDELLDHVLRISHL